MRGDLPPTRQPAGLIGRRAECGLLDRLAGSVRIGASRALVVHGEPGVGKTAPRPAGPVRTTPISAR